MKISLNLNLANCTANQWNLLHELDKTFVGTENYMGFAPFWHYNYRHYLRDATLSQKVEIHKAFMETGFCLNDVNNIYTKVIEKVLWDCRSLS